MDKIKMPNSVLFFLSLGIAVLGLIICLSPFILFDFTEKGLISIGLIGAGCFACIIVFIVILFIKFKQIVRDSAISQEALINTHQSELSLLENQKMLKAIIQSSGDAMRVMDLNHHIVEANMQMEKLSGYTLSECNGKNCSEIFGGTACNTKDCIFSRLRSGEKIVRSETVKYRQDGSTVEVEVIAVPILENGTMVGYLESYRDISQRKEDEKKHRQNELQYQHAQKMESIGTLAAGIAHEINTPIQFVGDNTAFLESSFKSLMDLIGIYKRFIMECTNKHGVPGISEKLSKIDASFDLEFLQNEIPLSIEQSREGVNRVSSIVTAMKDFSHMGSDEMKKENVNRAIENTVTISRNEWKYDAVIENRLDPDLPLVNCVIGDIKQVLLNLIVNAAHAIKYNINPSQPVKGKITIATSYTDENVIISVKDTGIGISDDIKDKIFEPFFTTKDIGKGTGQGLSLVYNVITKKHGGRIGMKSIVSKGTTFFIELPIESDLSEHMDELGQI